MTHWQALMHRARTSLIVVLVTLALCLLLVLGCHHWSAQAQAALAQSQSELSTQAAASRDGLAELQYMRSHIERYRQLVQTGLIGLPERDSWVQQLLASHQRLALPGPLRYTLHAPAPLPTAEAGLAVDGAVLIHDLEFSLSQVHEEEVMALLLDYGARVKGRMRVNSCSFADPTPAGLSAQCSLRFFTLPGPSAQSPLRPHDLALSAPVAQPPTVQPILGSLLYSRQERAAIVQARAEPGADAGNSRMRVFGLVKRERGKGTVWINRLALPEGQALPPAKQTRMTPAGIVIDGQLVRVGETLDLRSHERSDLVDPGALSVGEAP
jgi:hypothetical protein